jgi:hypothetical protein
MYGMSESFHINSNFNGPLVIQKKIFKDISNIKHVKTISPLVAPPNPRGASF